MRGEGLRSVLAIPLTGQTGEVYGALSVFYLRQHDVTPGDVELLSAFGTQRRPRSRTDARSTRWRGGRATTRSCTTSRSICSSSPTRTRSVTRRCASRAMRSAPTSSACSSRRRRRLPAARNGRGLAPGQHRRADDPGLDDSFAGYTFLKKTLVQVDDLAAERRFAIPRT